MVDLIYYIACFWLLFYASVLLFFGIHNRNVHFEWQKVKPADWFSLSAVFSGIVVAASWLV